jgi:hypothetical protein
VITYNVTLTNENALPGTYYLTNLATLTEDDSGDTHDDDATVTIHVPAAGILATEEHTVAWERETKYNWEIEKTVEPTETTLDSSDTEDLTYTIVATRLEPTVTSTYTISGRATATNNGNAVLNDIILEVEFNGNTKILINTGDNVDLNPGEKAGGDFTFETNSEPGSGTFTVTVTAKGTPGAGSDVTDTDSNDETAPADPSPDTVIDETASIEDNVTNLPVGFSLNPSTMTRNWNVTEPSKVITYNVTLTNENALPGTYYLTNLATLTEDDSGDTHDDDATVTIYVPSGECEEETAWAEGIEESSIPHGWGMYFNLSPTEDSTTVRFLAGQHTDVGTVTAEWIEDAADGNVRITILTTGGWRLGQVHVQIIYNNDFSSYLGLGDFEINEEIDPYQNFWTGTLNKDSSKTLYIAVHADVWKCD